VALYLKDPELDRKARALAAREGTTITKAVERAIDARLALLMDRAERRRRASEETLQRLRGYPVLDARDPDDLLYDKDGLPKS
jgi:antitoxin VapB